MSPSPSSGFQVVLIQRPESRFSWCAKISERDSRRTDSLEIIINYNEIVNKSSYNKNFLVKQKIYAIILLIDFILF